MSEQKPGRPLRYLTQLRRTGVSPGQFRRITLIATWALGLTIVSGGVVRLTGSGLGCETWPSCTSSQVVAPWQYHAWVEFGNRLLTTLVSVVAVLAVIGALARRPRRRDLTWLSIGLVGGIIAEIVLGGLTVLANLAPGFVMAHFLLAAVFLADAVVLHHRAGLPDEWVGRRTAQARRPARPLVSRRHIILARVLLGAAAVVVCLGTIVTSTGPHGGDPKAHRFALSLHGVAQLHGSSVEVFLGLTLLTLWSLGRSHAPETVMRRAEILLVVLVIQGGIGYLQYFNGDPVAIVGLHLVGATALMVAVLHFNLGLYTRPAALQPVPAQAREASRRETQSAAAPPAGAAV